MFVAIKPTRIEPMKKRKKYKCRKIKIDGTLTDKLLAWYTLFSNINCLRLVRSVLVGARLLGEVDSTFCLAEDIGGGFVGELQVLFDVGAVLHLEEDNGCREQHTSQEKTPARSELGHKGSLDGVQAEIPLVREYNSDSVDV
jgi:hypothetical protein